MKRVRSYILPLCVLFLFLHPHFALAKDCDDTPVSVMKPEWCDYIKRYPFMAQDAENRRIDVRVKEAMGLADDTPDKMIRSYAFVVSVWKYQFGNFEKNELQGVQVEQAALQTFLKEQGFDEALIIQNDEATADAIRKIMTEYYLPRFMAAAAKGQKIRFLFLFDGHGWQPPSPDASGALALGDMQSDADLDYDHRFSLAELRGLLQDLSPYTQSMVALLGECYSGSVFTGTPYAEGYEIGPSAWIAASAPRGMEAWELGSAGTITGTVFFQDLISVIDHWKAAESALAMGDGSNQVDFEQYTPNLRELVDYINKYHRHGINPKTGQPYPPIIVDTVSVEGKRRSAFRFIVPTKHLVVDGVDLQHADLTGSSVIGHPNISIIHTPEYYKIRGIDLSRGNINDDIDFATVKAEGDISFVYLKATQGKSHVDGKFIPTMDKVLKAGLAVGAYHTFDFCDSVDDQMKNIGTNVPIVDAALPIAIDIEWYNGKPGIPAPCNPTIGDVKSRLRDLSGRIEEHYGKKPVYYLVYNEVKNLIGDDAANSLWIANFSKKAKTKGLDAPWTFWQFTDKGRFPTITNSVDINVFFGDAEQFSKFAKTGQNVAFSLTEQ